MHCVYKHTTPSGKVYIGITKQNTSKRWQRGYGYVKNIVFYRAIMKYGWDAIQHEVLLEGLTEDEAKKAEVELIAQHNSSNPKYGYNITSGGDSAVSRPRTEKEKAAAAERWRGSGNPNARPVICLETLEVFDTAVEAAERTGAHKIKDCCKRLDKHRTSGGYHWAYYDAGQPDSFYEKMLADYIEEESRPRVVSERARQLTSMRSRVAVVCVETGEVFKSMRDAAAATGANPPNICNCCKGKKKTAAGFHWQYAGGEC